MGKETLINSHTQIIKGKYVFSDEIEKTKNGECEYSANMHAGKTSWFSQSILTKLCRKNY
ncbi:hypothetical protein D6853_14230 [Butyrivibrio sp. X503]|uniref:hypothetical protein n=1 Tax=Butyrivibrio sp. X503 TaxID=2364878 RepID=UPI000EA8516B|nr:hypothetical protein [Butyrivibrio sp. X503]RKM54092.1 hypothetical protein D6853_14230 [Butyrivibrio sp. X503]